MENILYAISNINMETVELVASCLKKRYKDGFSKIVLFESPESEEFEFEQIKIYRKYFEGFEKTVVLLNSDGSIPADRLCSVFELEGNKVVDLSNGQKATTSSLYLASSLSRIEDVHCLLLHTKPRADMVEGQDFDYLKLKRMDGIERLAKLSYFDLIYYTEDVKALITAQDRKRSSTLKRISNGMHDGITGFFTGDLDPRTLINSLTVGNEAIINRFLEYLRHDKEALAFANDNADVNLFYSGDPIGILSRFFKNYVRNGTDRKLVCLCTVPGLLSGLRDYRNISAHYSENNVILTDDNVCTVINMELEVLKCVHQNDAFWRKL